MNLRCRLAAVVPGRWVRRHAGHCLRCQAQVARSRALERDLRALRDDMVPAPPGLAVAILDRLPPQDSLLPRRVLVVQRVVRQATAAAVAAATGAAVAAGLLRRRKRLVVSH